MTWMPNHRNVYISLATSMSKNGKFQLKPLVKSLIVFYFCGLDLRLMVSTRIMKDRYYIICSQFQFAIILIDHIIIEYEIQY